HAVGQAGQPVVAGEVADARLGGHAFGDVLNHHHRAAVRHWLEGKVEGATAYSFELERAGFAGEPFIDRAGELVAFGAKDYPGADAVGDQLAHGRALAFAFARQAEELSHAP